MPSEPIRPEDSPFLALLAELPSDGPPDQVRWQEDEWLEMRTTLTDVGGGMSRFEQTVVGTGEVVVGALLDAGGNIVETYGALVVAIGEEQEARDADAD